MTDKAKAPSSSSLAGIKQVWEIIAGYRGLYGWAAIALFLSTGFQFLVPLVGSATIDFVLTPERPEPNPLLSWVIRLLGGPETVEGRLWIPAIAIVGFACVSGVFNYLQKVAAARASDGICKRLKDRLYDHIQRMTTRYIDQAQTGDLVQRCTSDVETLRIFLAAHVVEIGRAAILLATVLPFMLIMDVRLTVASMALVPLVIAYGYFYIKRVKRFFGDVDEAEGKLTAVVQENITGIRVVRAFGRHDFEIEKFAGPNAEYRDKSLLLIRLMARFWAVSDFACLFQVGVALIAGAALAVQGEVSAGTVFAFLALVNMVLWPIRMIGRILTDFGKTVVALERIQEILTQPYESAQDQVTIHPSAPSKGRIEFRGVTFAHQERAPTVADIALEVEPGETLAIVGPSGSGKTTLMHLLLRFYDPDQGTVLLDGQDIRNLDREYLRRQFGVVLQEPFLYARSIRENITLGSDGPVHRDIEEVARLACIHDTIQSFHQGYETEIGERGITLSGGQRQRVAIARALLPDHPALLLDDALSAVDSETEASILAALQSRRGKQTTIVIAHRLSTLAHADKIVVLEKGRITQMGTHETLRQAPGLYRRLWEIQTQLETALEQEELQSTQP